MRVFITAKPRAGENKIEKIDETNFKVSVTAPPVKGFANKAIVELLADHFNVSNSQVKLVSGFSSKEKVFEIYKN